MATKLDSKATEKVVIFLGFTGSGKSTATKFILKDQTLKIEEDFQVNCIYDLEILSYY
jgi:putative ribosome biogenesis GTPase RsgA